MIRPAHDVFKSPEFSADELARIFAAAQGQTLFFGSVSVRDRHCSSVLPALLSYARGEDHGQGWREALSVSVRRFYQVLAAERKNCCPERVLVFQEEGLSLRQLAVLFDRSVPTIQRLLEGKSDTSNPTNPTDSAPKEA
jgi:hypothetical protein